jgi:hypothetical protein
MSFLNIDNVERRLVAVLLVYAIEFGNSRTKWRSGCSCRKPGQRASGGIRQRAEPFAHRAVLAGQNPARDHRLARPRIVRTATVAGKAEPSSLVTERAS